MGSADDIRNMNDQLGPEIADSLAKLAEMAGGDYPRDMAETLKARLQARKDLLAHDEDAQRDDIDGQKDDLGERGNFDDKGNIYGKVRHPAKYLGATVADAVEEVLRKESRFKMAMELPIPQNSSVPFVLKTVAKTLIESHPLDSDKTDKQLAKLLEPIVGGDDGSNLAMLKALKKHDDLVGPFSTRAEGSAAVDARIAIADGVDNAIGDSLNTTMPISLPVTAGRGRELPPDVSNALSTLIAKYVARGIKPLPKELSGSPIESSLSAMEDVRRAGGPKHATPAALATADLLGRRITEQVVLEDTGETIIPLLGHNKVEAKALEQKLMHEIREAEKVQSETAGDDIKERCLEGELAQHIQKTMEGYLYNGAVDHKGETSPLPTSSAHNGNSQLQNKGQKR